jgi:hypothetical protein
VPEEGLADALEFLQSECESLSRRGAKVSDEELFRHFVRKFGAPEDVAASYALATGPSLERAEGEATPDGAATIKSDDPARHSKRLRMVAVVLALVGAVIAFCGASAWISRVQDGAGLDFMTHQGVTYTFPLGKASFADRVVSFHRELSKASRSADPQASIGIPDCSNDEREEPESSYVSLGDGGELTVEFTDNVLFDDDGPDLAIFEVGPRLESVWISVSEDGETWVNVGKTNGRIASLDLASLEMPNGRFRFVRIVDTKRGQSNDSPWPGADVDAIGAINSLPR